MIKIIGLQSCLPIVQILEFVIMLDVSSSVLFVSFCVTAIHHSHSRALLRRGNMLVESLSINYELSADSAF